MTTMTDPTQAGQLSSDEPNTPKEPTIDKTIDLSPADKLRDECAGCRLSFNWFTTSKKVDDESKRAMATSVETTEAGFSASKRLMDSKHPSIKKANELRSRISAYWTSMTVPLAAANVVGEAKLEGGTRLLRREDVSEFHTRMIAFQSETETVMEEVNVNLEDIKAMDKERLGHLFNEDDYPGDITLAFSWGFPNIEVPSYLAELAPEVYEQERAAVAARFEQTYDLATVSMLQELEAVFASWVDRLGPVVRVYPPDHAPEEFRKFRNAELLERIRPDQDESIASGQIKVKLRYKLDNSKKSKTEVVGPFPETYFNDIFKPSGMADERKTFRESTIQNLSDLIRKFGRLGDTISASSEFSLVMQQMEDHLAQCSDVSQVTKELRDSNVFRQRTHELANQLKGRISGEIATFKKHRRVTRQA